MKRPLNSGEAALIQCMRQNNSRSDVDVVIDAQRLGLVGEELEAAKRALVSLGYAKLAGNQWTTTWTGGVIMRLLRGNSQMRQDALELMGDMASKKGNTIPGKGVTSAMVYDWYRWEKRDCRHILTGLARLGYITLTSKPDAVPLEYMGPTPAGRLWLDATRIMSPMNRTHYDILVAVQELRNRAHTRQLTDHMANKEGSRRYSHRAARELLVRGLLRQPERGYWLVTDDGHRAAFIHKRPDPIDSPDVCALAECAQPRRLLKYRCRDRDTSKYCCAEHQRRAARRAYSKRKRAERNKEAA